MNVIWLPKALGELEKAIRYSKREFGTKAAQKFIAEVKQNNTRLMQNPRMGAREEQLSDLQTEYRYLTVYPYKEIYHIEGEVVYIDLLWHTHRNPLYLQDEVRDYPMAVCEEALPYGKNISD